MRIENKKYIVIDFPCESVRWEVGNDSCEIFNNMSGMPNKTKKLTDLYYMAPDGKPFYLFFMEEMQEKL